MTTTRFAFAHQHLSRVSDGVWQLPALVGHYTVSDVRDLVRRLMVQHETQQCRLVSVTLARGEHNVPMRLTFTGDITDILEIEITEELTLVPRMDGVAFMDTDEPVHYKKPVTYLADRHVFAPGQASTLISELLVSRAVQLARFNDATPAVMGNKVVSRANRDMLNTPWFVNRAKGDPVRTAEYVVEDNHTSSTAISKLTVVRDILGAFSLVGYMNEADCVLPEDPYLLVAHKLVSIPHGSSYAVPLADPFRWGDTTVDGVIVTAAITNFSLLGYIA